MKFRKLTAVALSAALLFGLAVPSASAANTGGGLWGEYYTGKNYDNYVTGQKDTGINFTWATGTSPVTGLGSENYSIRWSGRIKADVSADYTFTTAADDGAKLFIDGNQIISDAGPHTSADTSGSYFLEADKDYELTLEYYNGELGGNISLYWARSGMSRTLVPASALSLPEYQARVSFSQDENGETISAIMTSDITTALTLYVEKYDLEGNLVDTISKSRSRGELTWEVTDVLGENKDFEYYAVVKDKSGNEVSEKVHAEYGVDYNININSTEKTSEVSDLMYGVCMEDVNHELYGGIWSQMIFGESFAEPSAITSTFEGDFTAAGGEWYSRKIGNDQVLGINITANGPKLTANNTECSSGVFSADVKFDGDAAGFITKVSRAAEGADSFNGYEISMIDGAIRLAKHQYNYTMFSETKCSDIIKNTWINLKVVMTESDMSVYVNDNLVVSYNDTTPLKTGLVGFRSWNADAQFKNIKFTGDDGIEKTIEIPESSVKTEISGMWDSEVSGSAESAFSLIYDEMYKDSQSQRIAMTGGSGTVGLSNKSLNRMGMNFVSGNPYEGYIYAKSATPVTAKIVLESMDGKSRYAEQEININSSDWTKYSFELVPDKSDSKGKFVIELSSVGAIDVGYAYLQPGEWGRYKGLPVRKDVGEMLENQGLSVMRFGGCMAQTTNYRWKNQTGDPETRPSYKGWWYGYSSNGFGIIEFLDLCEALGIVGIPDFVIDEDPQDMADFMMFATGTDTENEWVKLRISMGHPEPYSLPYMEIGNENKVDEAFADKFNAIADAIWAVNKNVTLVAGDFEYSQIISDPNNFSGSASGITNFNGQKKILDHATANNQAVWFDIHMWCENGFEPESRIQAGISVYNALKSICPDADFALPVFELNANSHSFSRALCNAYAINKMERYSDIFPIVCSANALQVDKQNDNGWNQGLLFMDNSGAWYQAPAYVDKMFGAAHLPYTVNYTSEQQPNTADFDTTVTADESGSTVCIKIVNRSGASKGLRLNISNFVGFYADVKMQTYSESLSAANTTENKEQTMPDEEITLENASANGTLRATVDGYSITVITLIKTDRIDEILTGDVDFDGNITVSDVVALRRIIMSGKYTDDELAAGDIDTDGKLTVSDVVALRQLIMRGQ